MVMNISRSSSFNLKTQTVIPPKKKNKKHKYPICNLSKYLSKHYTSKGILGRKYHTVKSTKKNELDRCLNFLQMLK